jgi:hypothetical protein
MPGPHELTRHHAMPRRYLGRDILSGHEGRGYTALDLFKFYGLITALLFALAFTYIKYLDLFAEALKEDPVPGVRLFARLTVIPLLMGLIALEGFLWWASGALMDYTRWQRGMSFRLSNWPWLRSLFVTWQWFWFIVLNFYLVIELDPFDTIHRQMSRSGLAPAPNMVLWFSGKLESFQFQWGYFLLWLLLWFLIAAAHASYFADGLREAWFYIKRINRYSASVLTGFRGTAAVAMSPPVTRTGPLPVPTVLAPRLNVSNLSEAQAAQVVAADASGAISAVPGQRGVLLVDLGAFYWSPALAALKDDDGNPLLVLEQHEIGAVAGRAELVVPLVGVAPGFGVQTSGVRKGPDIKDVAQSGALHPEEGELQ